MIGADLTRMRTSWRSPSSPWDDAPIRSELFSVERLEDHARSLAQAQTLGAERRRDLPLARRLPNNQAVLLEAYQDVVRALADGAAITPAAEWLVDNFHVVERQIRDVRADLPPGYYRQLPKLAGGPFAGYPRVFGAAWAFVAHTDSLFDPEVLRRYLRAYQEVQPLTIGELWAVPITLRIVLVENLRRIAERVTRSRAERKSADALADRLLGAGGRPAEPASEVLPAKPAATYPDAFLVQLTHRLRDQEPSVAPALRWLDAQLARRATTAEAVVRDEHQRQVAASLTVRNIITSMRLISDVDWSELFERVSLTDDLFREAFAFEAMDFPTRNLYRSAVETLARSSGLDELQVAEMAVAAARRTPVGDSGADPRLADPGYFLIAGGRVGFEAEIGARAGSGLSLERAIRALGIGGYVAAGVILAAVLLVPPLGIFAAMGVGWPLLAVLALLGAGPAGDLAVAVVNFVTTRGFRARPLPSLELAAGVPAALRTLVATPMLLSSLKTIEEQLERLEVHYLASPEGEVYFALLSDWTDAVEEHAEDDEVLLAAARDGVAALNRRHARGEAAERFFLFHRRRVWSATERRWIGWERKRGKLEELNRLLRGATDTTYIDPAPPPPDVRFVITLDADTRLPRETVGRLIGKIAHPLNRPRLDPHLGRVVEGYGILQPRVTPALPSYGEGSPFLRVFSSAPGIDPYAAAVSDVYQDLFDEGSYTGKGIYDVDAFQASLEGRVPDSTLLSHDLFEGVFARAGLASDVEVVEDFPARYDGAALRQHRWARGDWQLLPWILGDGPKTAKRRGGPPAMGRWKMADNLRRSLSAPLLVLALVAGWLLPPGDALAWTALMAATLLAPPLLGPLAALAARRPGVTLGAHLRATAGDVRMALAQGLLNLALLAHQGWLMADAIVRTLVRMAVTRRRLLEWSPAAQAAFGPRPTLARFYRRMSGAVAIAGLAVAVALAFGQGTWPLALLFALAWAASPAIAYWISVAPPTPVRPSLSEMEARTLRLIARRTWRFFEAFVTPLDNHLPPDNFQETPEPVAARRTSPTNIGLYLLSVGCARDFGWIGTLEAVERLEATLDTLNRMPKHRGHLLNWYDTRDLRPLDPQYVSSVDSGNLAGHLIALAQTCRAWRADALKPAQRLQGVADTLDLAAEEARRTRADPAATPAAWRRLDEEIALLRAGTTGEDSSTALETRLQQLCDDAGVLAAAVGEITLAEGAALQPDLQFWTDAVRASAKGHLRDLAADDAALSIRLERMEQRVRAFAMGMDFGFLMNPDRLLLSIGYQVVEGLLDSNCYDLLASEARLASFFAIAKRDAPARHWFRLGRAVVQVDGGAALISWSGSMFEYLMPSIVMVAPVESLLEESNRQVVRRQIAYGATLKTPWGVSESAYNARDLELTYQYSNFGVPGLGLKRGLANNAVIAPYATALAAMIDPAAAVANFAQLSALGAGGAYGFYEALDFTPERVPEGQEAAIVRSFMAHHQGMSVTAIADVLLDGAMRRRFHAEPLIQASELLLQERAPREVAATPASVEDTGSAPLRELNAPGAWRTASPHGVSPAAQLLSNGRYSVMLTAAGSGYSTWKDLAVTRWREDATCDDWGSYVFLRDVASGRAWSAAYQPIGEAPQSYEVAFNEDRAEFVRRDADIVTSLQVLVSAEDDAEVRRVTLTNAGTQPCVIEVTSYVELVLTEQGADVAHPAFAKLFVETEHLGGLGALLATRRRRARDDEAVWAAHLVAVEGETEGAREFETDRARFLGRAGLRAPAAVMGGRPLSGATGAVLDPIFALRRRVRIAPGGAARLDFWTLVGGSRDEVLTLIDKHHDVGAFERAANLAWTQAQVQLYHLGVDRARAALYQRLASYLLYATPALRPPSETVAAGTAPQSGLWSMGISGDRPILLVRIADMLEIDLAREVIQAVEYWRTKRFVVDLVILNERAASYVQDLQQALEALVRANQSRAAAGDGTGEGHIYILRGDQTPPEARALLYAVARVVLVGERGSLADQLERAPEAPRARLVARAARQGSELQVPPRPPGDAVFFNGLGAFAADGREYLTILGPGQSTPAPWLNVIANPDFGFQVSAEGGNYTWSVNSRERQLTPWCNDPVTDRPGQCFYLRDEDTGALWTPTASPIRDEGATYVARHGWGYSRFEHTAQGIAAELLEFVPRADAVKISRLKLRNLGNAPRRLSVTGYVEWVLGQSRAAAAPFTVTRIEPQTTAMLATNAWRADFAGRVAFADMGGRQSSWTGDRREFIGRNSGLSAPTALAADAPLSRRVGAGLDPCAALQRRIVIPPHGEVEVLFLLGDAADEAQARTLIESYRTADLDAVLGEVRSFWEETLTAVQVKTPDRSMDLMLNGWLLYQTLACRIWARSGFYQASGAYGFRDQLQDGMALTTVRPQLTREHLLRVAGRQFPEGDVQHWWLPHTGQGVRTRISDDRAWMAYGVARYVRVSGDKGLLDEAVPFLNGPELKPDQHDNFFQPEVSQETTSVYEHCARALDASLAVGAHGAPLMGTGDWNDGMNRVGEEGRGESVWLGWLLIVALRDFADLADGRGDAERAAAWRAHASGLAEALDANAWDGDWYRRGWFDDGAPLGSAASEECRIDAIAQSWAVLSGAGQPERAVHAMASVERELILPEENLALLFTPPFDKTPLEPGYIKGYPPGVRENGGQYTHASTWSVIAFAKLGEGDKAAALFHLLNPVNHARTRTDVHRYKVEPYVIAADVYSSPRHVGRGGWTWYTGSAGWMQRAGIEGILGLRIEAGVLYLDPVIPAAWPGFEIKLRQGGRRYDVVVENPDRVQTGVISATLDGAPVDVKPLDVEPLSIPLVEDGLLHRLEVRLGRKA